jgi:dTDP-4-amino-4,6-dideoxygalactose transaminase
MHMRDTFLPYALPSIGEEEIQEVVDSLRSGWVTTGPKTRRFEDDFRQYVQASHAAAVNSCTAALHLSLCALGIGPGDEVIVPTLTFCSTANVVIHLGATPVLVDVNENFHVTAEAIEAAITKRTKAIVPVHFGGQAVDLREIYQVALNHNLPVVEDGAHAVGCLYMGEKIGADSLPPPGLKRLTAFSFYAIKNMTTGEGGMITTSDPELATRVRLLTLHGMSKDAWKRYTSSGSWYYEVLTPGYKDNMTDIQAAMGIHQLRKLDGFIAARQGLARVYEEAFCSSPHLETPVQLADRNHAYHLYVIKLNLDRLKIDRDQFIEELKAVNIGTSVHFIPVHLHPFYRDRAGDCAKQLPVAENLYKRMLSLPLYPRMTAEDAEQVANAVTKICEANSL